MLIGCNWTALEVDLGPGLDLLDVPGRFGLERPLWMPEPFADGRLRFAEPAGQFALAADHIRFLRTCGDRRFFLSRFFPGTLFRRPADG